MIKMKGGKIKNGKKEIKQDQKEKDLKQVEDLVIAQEVINRVMNLINQHKEWLEDQEMDKVTVQKMVEAEVLVEEED